MKQFLLLLLGTVLSVGNSFAEPVSGTVVGPDNKPVVRAQVSIFDWVSHPSLQNFSTDGTGRFQADPHLYPQDASDTKGVDGVVFAPGFGLERVSLRAGKNLVQLSTGIDISGSVADVAGKPAEGATVTLEYLGDDPYRSLALREIPELKRQFTVKTGADGVWRMTNLPAEGYATIELKDRRYLASAVKIDLTNAAGETPILTAKPGSYITGKVAHQDGHSAAGVEVRATRSQDVNVLFDSTYTDADGNYELVGLDAGVYRVVAMDPSGEWFSSGLYHIATQLGKETDAATLVLERALTAQGSVVDADDHTPLEGVKIYAVGLGDRSSSTVSDAGGRYSIGIAKGTQQLTSGKVPPGYLPAQTAVEVTGDHFQIPTISLRKGAVLRGTAVDEQGKPATGSFLYGGDFWVDDGSGNRGAKVDAQGNWKIVGLWGKGSIALHALGAWTIVSPLKVTIPSDVPIVVTVRRVPLVPLAGRIVTPDGIPIAGVAVKASISGEPMRGDNYFRTHTDEAGRYSFGEVRPDAKIHIAAALRNYQLVKGGEVTASPNRLSVDDFVLSPLTNTLKGTVVDMAGKPVAGAYVASPADGGKQIVTTDAGGRFTLRSLAAGDIEVMAAHGHDWGQISGRVGANGKDIVVAIGGGARKPIAGIAEISALVEGWVTGANNTRDFEANASVREIARVDPDRALSLVTKDDGSVTEASLAAIMEASIQSDPQLAADWIPPRLDQLKTPRSQLSTMVDLGLSVADTQPDLAMRMYRRIKTLLDTHDYSLTGVNAFAGAAALAAKLKLPEADNLMQAALIAAERSAQSKERDGISEFVMNRVAEGSPELAVQVLAKIDSADKFEALAHFIPVVAPRNPVLASRMLAEMKKGFAVMPEIQTTAFHDDGYDRRHADNLFSRAATSIAEILARTDTVAAADIAREVRPDQRTEVLDAVAKYAKGESAKALYREAVEAATDSFSSTAIAHVASLVYTVDPQLGEVYFEKARTQVAESQEPHEQPHYPDYYTGYAYYHAPIDPARSRLLLELDLARILAGSPQEIRKNSQWLGRIAKAMVAVDPERAIAIAQMKPVDGWETEDVEAFIVRYLLTPVGERPSVAFPW